MPHAENPLPCLLCGTTLSHAVPLNADDHHHNQPDGGLAFETAGHYGSTLFDPMRPGVRLEIAVCDDCLNAHWHRTRQVLRTRQTDERVLRPAGLSYAESVERDPAG